MVQQEARSIQLTLERRASGRHPSPMRRASATGRRYGAPYETGETGRVLAGKRAGRNAIPSRILTAVPVARSRLPASVTRDGHR